MKSFLSFRAFVIVFAITLTFLTKASYAAPTNDLPANAKVLTPVTTCSTVAGDLAAASATGSPASTCGTANDVWYSFTVPAGATSVSISVNLSNPNLLSNTTTFIEVFNATAYTAISASNSLGCNNLNAANSFTTLTAGQVYYFRVFTTDVTSGNSNKYGFTVCVTYVGPPANDNCTNATALTTPTTTCSNTSGTLALATASSPAVSSSCTGSPGADVWYTFTATNSYPTISLSSIGTNLSSAGVSIQIFSGTCGNLTSLDCTSGSGSTVSTNGLSLNVFNSQTITGLITSPITTYYIRIYTPTTAPTGNGWDFNICITNPSTSTANVTYSKSYINISKGTNGGLVDTGDTLEMRTTFVITTTGSMVDSLSFNDTLFNTKGLALVPGSIALRTNEGKVYKSFTDGFDTDAGWMQASGLDTVVRINFGTSATGYNRGRLSYQSKPSVFGSTCIVMATYRTVVYASYNTKINFKTGSLTYRDISGASPTPTKVTFTTNNLIVYQSPGLCPNAVSASNAVGVETNGTFGTPSGSAPLARNRGTSPYTKYTYGMFTALANAPQDLYYGITNNTSGKFTTTNTWLKPDGSKFRIFDVWDIIGDHTKASNTAQGNPACDTTLPVSTSNPCGYMLVINSAYKTDTAFQYTASNLCPNTYYEISAWFRNICYKCGCDSNGVGATSTSSTTQYIPFATNDSSGVQPNIAFDVNGTDYYTTGNIQYFGTTQSGSDATNKWVKRGFTYLTGAAETSFTLTLRNNAPGGGGNDWAMDDISIATCLPNMQYSPTTSPSTCMDNTVQIRDTISSYFNNYNNYIWQRSTNGGTSWTDISGTTTSGASQTQVNGQYQYITAYTIPPTATQSANNGDKYRVIVATTSSNLSNSNCQFTDGVSIITLTVLNNCSVLPVKILSFNGNLVQDRAHLFWTVSREEEPVQYSIEKSTDGISFLRIGLLHSRNLNAEQTQYSFTDTAHLTGRAWYRIALVDQKNSTLYSRSILLSGTPEMFMVANVVNPFRNDLPFDVAMNQDGKLNATLYTLSGMRVKQQNYTVYKGMNGLNMTDLKSLAQGMYLLQVQYDSQTIIRKVIKQ